MRDTDTHLSVIEAKNKTPPGKTRWRSLASAVFVCVLIWLILMEQ